MDLRTLVGAVAAKYLDQAQSQSLFESLRDSMMGGKRTELGWETDVEKANRSLDLALAHMELSPTAQSFLDNLAACAAKEVLVLNIVSSVRWKYVEEQERYLLELVVGHLLHAAAKIPALEILALLQRFVWCSEGSPPGLFCAP